MKFGVIFVCLFAVSIFFVSSFSITGKGVSGDVNIGVDESTRLIIHSPLNTTYNFEPNEDFLVDLNVTSMLNITGWRYSLYDFLHSSYVKTEEGFNPNTTIETVRKANKLIVQAREEGGNWITKEVIFYVNVSNAAPIINYVDDEILACEGQTLEYFFNATDSDEDALVSDITPKNPFYTSTLGTTGNVTFFKIFSSKLSKSHPGNYSETLSVSDLYGPDCCVDTKITNISVIEINNLPLMSGIGAQTVWTRGESSNFYHQMGVSDIEDGNTYDGNLRFNISFSDNENLFSIDNYYGIMNYTPSAGDIGVYSVRVCAEDNPLNGAHKNISYCLPYGNWSESACDNFTITVTDVNRNPQIIAYSPEENNFSVGSIDISSFYVRTYDPDLTIPDIDWYVGGVLKEHNEENEEDNFSYTFGCDVSGNFTIMAVATDGLANATHKWNVSVNLVACPPEQKRTGGGGGG
ncbi:MAG: hypothetical protein Q8N88_03130, partial [Nanoarchaeota archaeon]|nr:hypothetical protein [Nanoarchaeota archaeon]